MSKMKTLISLMLCVVFFASAATAQQTTLTMVYKDTGKPPYMEAAPDNSGLYFDLISRATKKIGFDLRIERGPKKRTYSMLETGEADIYASGEFNDKRSDFLFYMPNGLYRREHYWGMTALSIPPLQNISEITTYGLRWIFELGSTWPTKAAYYAVPYSEQPEVTIERAIDSLRSGRPFFFQFIKEEIEEYKDKKAITSWKSIGIRIHKSCGENKDASLYTAFSRKSPHYSEAVNTAYDRARPLSAENFPYRLVPGTVPYRLQEALQEMKDSGEVKALVLKYFDDYL
ncbi:hypothetical protein OAN24_03310, partial [Pseudodesulfovibrio sp.]|nr:hypothetical protein [Pseudodesulfovibrio sp.]